METAKVCLFCGSCESLDNESCIDCGTSYSIEDLRNQRNKLNRKISTLKKATRGE